MKAKAKSAAVQPFLAVDGEVVRQIRQHARSSSQTEVCGVLIGRDRDHRIEVAACIEGQDAEEAGAHVTFTQETWEHIYAVKDKKYPDERIVGWYHSHPGFGVFLSEHDTFIHRNFFSSPGQVAWVFDPHSDEEGCFGWVGEQIQRLTQIAVIDRRGGERADAGEKPVSIVEKPKDDASEAGPEGKGKSIPIRIRRSEADDSSDSDPSSLEQLVAKVFFSLALLALGGALSWFFLPHLVLVPVLVDPLTGHLIDPQTGQVLQEPQGSNGAKPGLVDPSKLNQPPTSDGGPKKGADVKSK
jgi:proteasome lid subunit RPN8/RPN11